MSSLPWREVLETPYHHDQVLASGNATKSHVAASLGLVLTSPQLSVDTP